MGGTADLLADLLDSDAQDVTERGRARFADAAGSAAGRIVLAGTGQVGRLAVDRLRRAGIEPLAVTDNDAHRWGTDLAGIRVLPPAEAVDRYAADSVVVATLFNPDPVLAQFQAAGCERVVPWTWLAWHYHEQFLPYFGLDLPHGMLAARDRVQWLHDLLDDDDSRTSLVEQVRWRLDLDPGALSPPSPSEDTYTLPGRLTPSPDDVFVDCGAFDGDTVRLLLEHTGGRARAIVALEPDPVNAARLSAMVERLPRDVRERVVVHQVAAGAQAGTARFRASGSAGSGVSDGGEIEVPVVSLDTLLTGTDATYVKMDVEGAELDALAGARHLIAAGTAAWAVCTYHAADHLWTVPMHFAAAGDRYRHHLRRYAADCWELVHYAVPAGRG